MLAQLGETAGRQARLRGAIDYLRETQRADGSWYGRWGMNYIYGTWSVLCALNAAGVDPASDPDMRKAADWLVAIQNPDGGWGEDGKSYGLDYRGYEPRAEHGIANGVGVAWADGSGSQSSIRRSRAASPISQAHRTRRLVGRKRVTPRRVFPAYSICDTTAIEVLSALGVGAVSQPEVDQLPAPRVRNVTAMRAKPHKVSANLKARFIHA